CIQQLSTAGHDLMKDGFLAERRVDEAPCPEIEINQLVEIRDVTDRIMKAVKGMKGPARNSERKAEMTRIEEECAAKGKWRCDVVTLYHGGRYDLYRYRRYQDVRLVFAPEFQVSFFGGDPDNFTFPRYDLDVSFLRVYEDGRPAKTRQHFRFSPKGAHEGELVFVTGHPGRTMRLYTYAQLEFLRDVLLPMKIRLLAEIRGILTEFSRRGAEAARIARGDLFFIENSFKAYKGMWDSLVDPVLMKLKKADERRIRARVDADPKLKESYGGAWDAIAAAQKKFRSILKRHYLLEGRGSGFSRLFAIARTLVRAQVEMKKPDDKRLREFTEAGLPTLKQRLFSTAPIYPALEEVETIFWLTKLREFLGPDDPVVRKILGSQSPASLAKALVSGSKLADVSLRKRLWKDGVGASKDPMILLARRFDQEARAVRKLYEDDVEAVETRNAELIARARFAVDGMGAYPDATFTLRLTWGSVEGYDEFGRHVNPVTVLRGLFERATGSYPYKLPSRWLDAKGRLDLDTPTNFASSCDIVGGNSGSPVINRDGDVVGLIFDGNIQSLGGAFWFDPRVNRAVAVETPFILEALRKVYDARSLVKELTGD
ncbi:MAG: S46 family peptidase, partial [Deltaproteobacteria bacterium]|nr:S46 family peptidase [Deltaproteobacteria bacterium]